MMAYGGSASSPRPTTSPLRRRVLGLTAGTGHSVPRAELCHHAAPLRRWSVAPPALPASAPSATRTLARRTAAVACPSPSELSRRQRCGCVRPLANGCAIEITVLSRLTGSEQARVKTHSATGLETQPPSATPPSSDPSRSPSHSDDRDPGRLSQIARRVTAWRF